MDIFEGAGRLTFASLWSFHVMGMLAVELIRDSNVKMCDLKVWRDKVNLESERAC